MLVTTKHGYLRTTPGDEIPFFVNAMHPHFGFSFTNDASHLNRFSGLRHCDCELHFRARATAWPGCRRSSFSTSIPAKPLFQGVTVVVDRRRHPRCSFGRELPL